VGTRRDAKLTYMTTGSSELQQLRRSPLDQWHRANGARMVAFGGWSMPLEYESGTVAEHMSCRRSAALFDVSHLGTVRVVGASAFGRLQAMLANDLGKIAPGRAQYTHLLDHDGSVLDDIIVWWVSEERFDVMPNASNTSRVLSAVGGEDVTGQRAVLALQGPSARQVMGRVVPEAAEVGRFRVKEISWGGTGLVVAGTGYTGEDGLECAVSSTGAQQLWEALVAGGGSPAGLGARDTLRLEAGLPLHGHELGPGITPLEAGLSWVVAWDKQGGFQGRQALLERRERGLTAQLKGMVSPGRQPLRAGYAAYLDGDGIGELTSGNFSPMLGCGIGLCFLPPGTPEGARLEVEARGRRLNCTVRRLPFVPKAGKPATGRAV
jgi:glycine cleavage system T protein (aminomethyltransferase)